MKLSNRIMNLSESATLAVAQRAKALREEGVDVINLSMGEPDFVTPSSICQAAKIALDDGCTGYAIPVAGLAAARQAICEKLKRDNGLEVQPDQVIITDGAKEALYLALMSLLDEGDEVIIPAPYWVSYPEQVKLAGGRPVIVQGSEDCGFRITPQQIQEVLTERTRVVIINSPSNPGGFVYSREELQVLSDMLSTTDITVISDEIYDRLTYDGHTHTSWATLAASNQAKTVTVNAVSKTYAMTGWRLGYAAGPVELIRAMSKLKGQTTSGSCHFNQYGLIEALGGDQSCVQMMHRQFDRRRQLMFEPLQELDGVSCVNPTGAMFCFPNVSGAFARLGVADSIGFAHHLLEQAHVAVVPGVAFGCDQNVRMSYATDEQLIQQAMIRIADCLEKGV